MRVVKLGGSLAGSGELPRWLHACAVAGGGRVVLVPGGGHRADEVRSAQLREGLDDARAHRLALRAMEAYGRELAEMQSGLVPAADVQTLCLVLREGRVPVWMPYDMVVGDASIPQTWEMTSDSLAAWLAAKLGASELVLVKSLARVDAHASVAKMAARGWVDPCFPRYATGRFGVRLLGKADCDAALALFSA